MTERDHLDPATIAALVDRTLDPAARAAAEAHLAACAGCREVWVETSEMAGPLIAPASRDARAPARPMVRRWWYAGAAIAASAVIGAGLWLLVPRQSRSEAAVARLAAAVGTERTTLARLSGPFVWGPPPDVIRGSAAPPRLEIRESAAAIERLATDATAENLAARGKAELVLGDPETAIETLDRALLANPSLAGARNDLAAAYLEIWRRTGDASAATRSWDHAERALQLEPLLPEALFNKARAIQSLGLTDAARRAWNRYLEVDATSEWADEARAELMRLDRGTNNGGDRNRLRWLDRTALIEWARSTFTAHPRPLHDAETTAEALVRSGVRDRALDLVQLAVRSKSWPSERRRCLARAILSLAEWDKTYEAGRLVEAEHQLATMGTGCGHLAPEVSFRRALLLHAIGRTSEAAIHAAQMSAEWQLNYPRLAVRLEQLRGIAALSKVDFRNGVNHHGTALELSERVRDEELIGVSHGYLAAAYGEQGDQETAWRHFSGGFSRLSEIAQARRRYQIVANAARVAEEAGWHGAALGLSIELLTETRDWTNPAGRIVAQLGEARARAALGDYEGSTASLDAATRSSEAIEDASQRAELQAEAHATTGRLLLAREPNRAVEALSSAIQHLESRGNRFRTAGLLLARGRAYRNLGRRLDAERDWLRGVELIEQQSSTIATSQLRVSRLDDVWDLFDELIAERLD
ncbi:MAG TPA: zf-HC2 domain-containing protein, partial [Vicinamibacterales bacterium]